MNYQHSSLNDDFKLLPKLSKFSSCIWFGIFNIWQMKYASILVLLGVICSLCNITIYSLPHDEKNGALHATACEDRKSPTETVSKGKNLLQKILRNRNRLPRYDVSVIYLKILCISSINLISSSVFSIYLFTSFISSSISSILFIMSSAV